MRLMDSADGGFAWTYRQAFLPVILTQEASDFFIIPDPSFIR